MGSDAEMQQDVLEFEFKPLNLNRRSSLDVEAITKDGGGRFEHTCGKTRLLVLGLLAFVLVYVSIASTRVDLPTIIVHVPPDDVEGNEGDWSLYGIYLRSSLCLGSPTFTTFLYYLLCEILIQICALIV